MKKTERNRTLIKGLWSYVIPYRKYFYISVVLAVILAIIAPLRPILIERTIDDFAGKGLVDMIVKITLIQFVILLLESFLRFVFLYLINVLGQNVVVDMRTKLFTRLLGKRLRFFHHHPVGVLSTRVVNDIEAVKSIFSDGIISIAGDVLMMISVILVMLYTNALLTLWSLLTLPLIWLATIWFKNEVNRNFQSVRNAVSQLNQYIQERLSGIYIIQAFGKEYDTQNNFEKINDVHTQAQIKTVFAYALYFPIVELLSAISVVILVGYGAFGGQSGFSTGELVAFIMYINMLYRPLRVIADKFNVLQMGLIAMDRVYPLTLVDGDTEEDMEDNGSADQVLNGDIVYDNVKFQYIEGEPVLQGINLTITAGESVAIIGATGSGKSTLIYLLIRLYQNYSGKISIGGVDIKSVSLEELRNSIGMVTQDVMLIQGSLLDNIRMQHSHLSADDVERAAKESGLYKYIEDLPGLWSYPITQKGSSLSAGQRQIIAFLRVLVNNPQILVLDEATASIDYETEEIMQEALTNLSASRTIIIIAHRLRTIENCDHVYEVKNGQLNRVR